MTWHWWYLVVFLVYTAVVYVAGEVSGNRLEQDARRELDYLRIRLADRIRPVAKKG